MSRTRRPGPEPPTTPAQPPPPPPGGAACHQVDGFWYHCERGEKLRRRLVAVEADMLNIRGVLSDAGVRCGETVRPSVEQVVRERDAARAQVADLTCQLREYAALLIRGSGDVPAVDVGRMLRQIIGEPIRHQSCHDACPCDANPVYRKHLEHHAIEIDCPFCPDPEDLEEPWPGTAHAAPADELDHGVRFMAAGLGVANEDGDRDD